MTRIEADNSISYQHSSIRCIYLVVYVDDFVLISSDHYGISQIKQHICHHFEAKDVISQRKYALDILEDIGLMNSKYVDTPMDPNAKILPSQSKPLSDPEKYRMLVGKLNYLTVTHLDHWNAVILVLKYIKGSPGKGLLYSHNKHSKVVFYSNVD